ncbi:MAG: hypothetical protein CMF51_01910 [Legionellales bacterium]|nr:hypothetical protein [Legionellales bacterium]
MSLVLSCFNSGHLNGPLFFSQWRLHHQCSNPTDSTLIPEKALKQTPLISYLNCLKVTYR